MDPRANGVVALLVLLSGGSVAHAQDTAGDPPAREGFWVGFGIGATHAQIDCSTCGPLLPNDPWEGGSGFGLYLAMGGTVQPNLLLGAELNLYGKRDNAQERDATLGSLSALLQYYPSPASGLYLKSGAGMGGSIMAGGPGLIESGGWAVQAGLGYELRVHPRIAVAPFGNFVQIISEGGPGRNRGIPAQGPRNPRYVQLGLALQWHRETDRARAGGDSH